MNTYPRALTFQLHTVNDEDTCLTLGGWTVLMS